jgi:hypothetical protein
MLVEQKCELDWSGCATCEKFQELFLRNAVLDTVTELVNHCDSNWLGSAFYNLLQHSLTVKALAACDVSAKVVDRKV